MSCRPAPQAAGQEVTATRDTVDRTQDNEGSRHDFAPTLAKGVTSAEYDLRALRAYLLPYDATICTKSRSCSERREAVWVTGMWMVNEYLDIFSRHPHHIARSLPPAR